MLDAGQLIVSLFVLVNRLNYANGCLSSIFYVAVSVLVAQDAHVGSKLNAAAFGIGPLWFGAVLAGLAVSTAPTATLKIGCRGFTASCSLTVGGCLKSMHYAVIRNLDRQHVLTQSPLLVLVNLNSGFNPCNGSDSSTSYPQQWGTGITCQWMSSCSACKFRIMS